MRTEHEYRVREVLKVGPKKKNSEQRPLDTALLTVPLHLCCQKGKPVVITRATKYAAEGHQETSDLWPIPNQAKPPRALSPPPLLSRPEGAFGESLAASTGAPLQRNVPQTQRRHVALRRGESERASALGARGDLQRGSAASGAAQSGAAGRRRERGAADLLGRGELGKFALAAWGGDAAPAFRACQPGESRRRRRRTMHPRRRLASLAVG